VRIAVAALLVGCSGAAPPEAFRRAWLVDTLTDDNRVWEGRWDALAEKYAAMAEDPYDYMRGSLAVFLRDLDRPGTGRAPTAFVSVPGSAAVLLVGDPHPENVGTFLPGEGPGPTAGEVPLRLEFNDFDGAGFGPYLVDVRRGVLGLLVLLDAAGYPRPALEEAARAFTEAYVTELEQVATTGVGTGPAVPTDRGIVVDHLWTDVTEEGVTREQLVEATEVVGSGRRFRPGAPELLSLDAEQHAQLDHLLSRWPAPDGFRVLDVARRESAGIASLPALRYVVAWDRGAPGPEDDELLQLREVVDPPVLPDSWAIPAGSFDDNPARLVAAAQLLWSRPDADVRLGGVADGAQGFKTQTWSSFQESLDHNKALRDLEALRTDDALALARVLGGVLGGAHARTVTHELEPALPALWTDLRGRTDAFVDERVADALPDLDRTLADHALFVSALDTFGPLLGAYGR
jgi:uncharacterized protein (DUF2252 family)